MGGVFRTHQRAKDLFENVKRPDQEIDQILEKLGLGTFELVTDELETPSEDEGRQIDLPHEPHRHEIQDGEDDEREQGAAYIDSGVVNEDGDRSHNREIDRTEMHQVQKSQNPQNDQWDANAMANPIARVCVVRTVFGKKFRSGHVMVP